MKKKLLLFLCVICCLAGSRAQAQITPITGTFTVCEGASTTLSDAATGTWSGTTSVAFVSPMGLVVGLTGGTVVVSYTETAGVATATVVVTPRPKAGSITGPNSVCPGGTINLTDDTTGGTWSSVYTGIATVDPVAGAVTGLTAGVDTITYAVTNACGTADSNYVVTVDPYTSAGTISGDTIVCQGATDPLSSTVGGGTWSSSNASIATISSGGGIITGIAVGTDTITYSVTGTCGTADSTLTITVNLAADPGVMTGASTVCEGDTVRFTDTTSGGIWTSSNSTVASVSNTGVVTGVSSDTASAVIFYTVTNGCGPVSAFAPITVDPLPTVGAITGVSSLCPGAVDTLTDTISGGAWSSSNTTGFVTSGGVVIPLSGVSGLDTISYSATNACGTNAATFVINITGSTAGIIAGDTTICIDHSTILIDSLPGGLWSLSNGFALISPATGVLYGVSQGADTVFYSFSTTCGTASSYYVIQISDCWPAAVNNIATGEFKVYPNPASGMITIEIPQSNSNTTITVTDLMGKVVMAQPAGNIQTADLDLSNIAAGNYLLKVTSGDNTYREKITVIK